MVNTRTRPSEIAASKPANRRRREKAASGRAPKPPASSKGASLKPPSSRAARAAERRQAIIDAGLDEFIARGFTATRLEDVAKRAGVAKGTIYLHFEDKESLFEELIRTALVPMIGRLHRSEEHTSELQSLTNLVCRLLLEKKKNKIKLQFY